MQIKEYTKEWNHWVILNTRNLKDLNMCLEIGSFEGITSNYIVENLLSSEGKLICVDPLEDSYIVEELDQLDKERNINEFYFFKGQRSRFLNNTKSERETSKIILHTETSFSFYDKFSNLYNNSFDFIYIDGDHRPDSVYKDAVNCFNMCKSGGSILFDDYEWAEEIPEKSTKIGIDRFLKEFEDRYVIKEKNYQILIEKIA